MFKPVTPVVDFPKLERELLKKWYKKGIVKKYLHKNDKSKKQFSFLDGPITANNPMGVHHAWGRTYKDLWQRFWNMRGYRQRFQNGFDEQGLWVEVEVEKELGLKSKKDIENLVPEDKVKSLEKFINLCKERVKKYSAIQTEQSKRLGYFMDWDNSYHTSSDENNYAIWNFLKVVHKKGWLYKGRDSVPWCPRCGTALSQHEILTEEYKKLTHRTVVFKLKIKGKDKEYLLAWTTTPWTIPGNVALAVDPKLPYSKYKNDRGEIVYMISSKIKDVKENEMLINKYRLTEGLKKNSEVKGSDLVGMEYEAPYDYLPHVAQCLKGFTHRVVSTDSLILPINPLEGTGIVHVAPGAGSEDFRLGKKYKLPVIDEIDEIGVFIEGFGDLSKLPVKEAMPKIIEDITSRGFNFKDFNYTHRYPTCWRCRTELVWRVVYEWYIAMGRKDQSNKTYREQMIEVAKKINWMPSWGLERELDWLKNIHDWLISKKRYWGLALPIYECQSCGNFEVIGSKEELKEKAIEGWEEFKNHSPHRPWVDQVRIKCPKCGKSVSRIPDVGNPWLDAGIVPFSTLPKEWFPADFITESFPGQFKNWFYSLIAMSTALKNTNPFKSILGFASVLGEDGRAMHKSWGNAIEFNEGADKIGVDVMRWMYVTQNPEQNLLFGYKNADGTRRKFHLILWNIYNFFTTYATVDKWKPKKKKIRSKNVLDQWILLRLNQTIAEVTNSLENYLVDNASLSIEKFVSDLSLWYIRRSRSRVGPSAENKSDKNDFYETTYYVLTTLSKLLAPFNPYISDLIYTNLTSELSVHLSDWPKEGTVDQKIEKQIKLARKIVEVGHSLRKEQGIIARQSLGFAWHSEPKEKITDVDILHLILQELNIEKWINEDNFKKFAHKNGVVSKEIDGFVVWIDKTITPELKAKGEVRDLVRKIQEERKKLGTKLDEKVLVTLPDWPKEFEKEIKRKALVASIAKGDFKVSRK